MDILSYILGKKAGGGGGEAVLVNKDISANGTYNASSDSADGYKKVVVDVPNTYAAGDEGKVVSNGALVSQGSDTVTENDTYDTTLISELTVNVSASNDDLAKRLSNTLVSYSNPNIASLTEYAFYGLSNLESVSLPSVAAVPSNAFRYCSKLTSVDFSNATSLAARAFSECALIESVTFPKVTTTADHIFTSCPKLKTMVFPVITQVGSNSFANDCYLLEKADMGNLEMLRNADFYNARNMSALILRKTDGVCTLSNANCLENTPLRGYGGSYSGHVYVPNALINSYKTSTNWSTLYSAYSDIFAAIEGSPYENSYADGTPIS